MPYKERKWAHSYQMFVKEKHDSMIKARGCADWRLQREFNIKTETNSHTISLEAIMMSCAIDVKERGYAVVKDFPGAYLHIKMTEDVHM